MADGTNDRTTKPPRTLFSLGRPGTKKRDDDAAEAPADESLALACGSCGAAISFGAPFCADCGTPVEWGDFDEEVAGDLVEGPVPDLDEQPVPVDEPAAFIEEPTALAEEPAPFLEEPVIAYEPQAVDESVGFGNAAADAAALPAATLYADPSQAEPLPPTPEGSWGISEPSFGTTEGDYVTTDAGAFVEEQPDTYNPPYYAAATIAPAIADDDVGTSAPSTYPSPDSRVTAAPSIAEMGAPTESLPYGSGPVHSSQKKSKTGLLIGIAGAALAVAVIGGFILMSGGDKGNLETAASSTTSSTKAPTTTAPPTTKPPTNSVTSQSVTTQTPTTSPSTTPAPTTGPTTGLTTIPPTSGPPITAATTTRVPQPATTLSSGQIVANPGSGGSVNLPANGGKVTITLQNNGESAAQCALRSTQSKVSVVPANCTVPPGGTVTVTVSALGIEGNDSIIGTMEGLGSYSLSIFLENR